jgi:hypothetical protein
MIRGTARARSGITLTEILISIMIMGIGVISLATLFPLGLIRLRNAQRLSRGAYLAESAAADLGDRNLLLQGSFYPGNVWYETNPSLYYNPWVQDTPGYNTDWKTGGPGGTRGAFRVYGSGLPVAYDPLWRTLTGIFPNPANPGTAVRDRFGEGVLTLRNDPTDGGPASANGLQRLTNLDTFTVSAVAAIQAQVRNNTRSVYETFVSPEDLVLQEKTGAYADMAGNAVASPSTVVPDLNMNPVAVGGTVYTSAPTLDWRFTWLFTGAQSDATNGTVFDGDIVICENRPLSLDTTGAVQVPSGETVVEAIWGYSSTPRLPLLLPAANIGYGSASGSRTVVLRWPITIPDPDVRVGGWIADVTYERSAAVEATRYGGGLYPAQRCNWYQIARKTEVTSEGATGYRRITVTTSTPVRAQSLLTFPGGAPATPVHVEAALIMPSVVNVYPRTVYTR